MDCGPVALTVLLGAHGLTADVDALRDVCATDVDGTSVDDLEEVACALGLDAEQVVVPWAQAVALPAAYLPAIVLTLTPDGYVHFVVAWRVARGRIDLVDPAVGRRRVRLADFAREVLTHELVAPTAAWPSTPTATTPAARCSPACAGPGARRPRPRRWSRPRSRAGPSTASGGCSPSSSDGDGVPVVAPAGRDEAGGALVAVRGAVLIRAPRCRDGTAAAHLRPLLGGARRRPSHELRALASGEHAALGGSARSPC